MSKNCAASAPQWMRCSTCTTSPMPRTIWSRAIRSPGSPASPRPETTRRQLPSEARIYAGAARLPRRSARLDGSQCSESRLPSFDLTAEGFEAHRDWERKLNDGKWGMVTWPEAYGGRALDLIRWLIFEEEYYRAGAPTRVNQNGIFLLGPTMMEFGTDEQKARFLPRMAAGDNIGRRPGPNRARAAIWPRCARPAPATAITMSLTARRSGRPARCSPTGPSGCFANPAANATRA